MHDHLHLADGRQGHRPRDRRRSSVAGSATVHGPDRRHRPNSADAVKTLRRREHPDHAADGDEPRRRDAHVHRARQRQRRHRRVRRTRRPARMITSRSTPAPAHFTPAQPVHDRRARPAAARSRSPRPSTGVTTVSAHTTRHRSAACSLTRDTDGDGAELRPGASRRGSTRRSRSRPTRPTRSASPHTFTVTLQKDTGTRHVRAGRRRARRLHAHRLERRGAVLNAAASTCDDAGANTNASGQCTIIFNSPTRRARSPATRSRRSTRQRLGARSPSRPTAPAGTRPTRSRPTSTRTSRSRRRRRPTTSGTTHMFTAHVNVNTGNGAASRTRPTARRSASRSTRGPGTLTDPDLVRHGRRRPAAARSTLTSTHDRRHDRLARTRPSRSAASR